MFVVVLFEVLVEAADAGVYIGFFGYGAGIGFEGRCG